MLIWVWCLRPTGCEPCLPSAVIASRPDGWEARFATSDAVKGWEELCRVAQANTWEAWIVLTDDAAGEPVAPAPAARPTGAATDRRAHVRSVAVRGDGVRPDLVLPGSGATDRLGRRGQPGASESDRVMINAGTS